MWMWPTVGYGVFCLVVGFLFSAVDHIAGSAPFFEAASYVGLGPWAGTPSIRFILVLLFCSMSPYYTTKLTGKVS